MKKLFQINKKIINFDIFSKLSRKTNKIFELCFNNFSSLFEEFKQEPAANPNFKQLSKNNNNPSFDKASTSNYTSNKIKSKQKWLYPSSKQNINSDSYKKFEPISTPEDYENSELPKNERENTDKFHNKNKYSKLNDASKFNNNHSKEGLNYTNTYNTTYSSKSKFSSNKFFPQNNKLNIPFAKDGKPISIFTCKTTEHVIGVYYTYKTYFNKDLNLLAKVLIRFCQVANYEGISGVENLAKLRIVKELIKNLSEKIDSDSSQNFENKVIIDIMKILKYNKVVEKVKERSYSIYEKKRNLHKKFDYESKEDKEIEMLIENFIVEKVLKNINLKSFLKNLENGNQMTAFIENLTMISKKTELKKNFKFLLFKAEILSNYDRIIISKYQTRNLIELLWAMANAHISLPDAYINITNELINRFEFLDFESKVQILFTSALQKNFNKKLIFMIFKDWKNQAKINSQSQNKIINDKNSKDDANNAEKDISESNINVDKENEVNTANDDDFLMNKILDSKLIYFKELLYFWNVWGQQNKKVDAVMSEEIFFSIMKFAYFKFIKRRRNGDDLIFTEYDQEKQTHKAVLLELDRINLFGFLLRYAPDYGIDFDIKNLCFEDLYLKRKKEREANLLSIENSTKRKEIKISDRNKLSAVDGLKMDSDEEDDRIINEIRKKQNESETEDIKKDSEDKDNNQTNDKDAELNINNDKNGNNNNELEDNDKKEEEIDEELRQKIVYYQTVANKDRKYELEIQDVIEEFVNIFGYNLLAYIENFGYNLISLAFVDKSFKMVNLLNKIFKHLSTEHQKISQREYVRICSLIPVFLKIIKFNSELKLHKNKNNNYNNTSTENQEANKNLLLSLLLKNEKNLINFLKGIISENNLTYFLNKNCEITVIMDIVEIIDRIRIFDNKIYAKITKKKQFNNASLN